MSYDKIDPELYDKRNLLIPRERYLYEHWKPEVDRVIDRYAKKEKIGLDLGCGSSVYFTPVLKKKLVYVMGIDLSVKFLKYGKYKDKSLNLICGDAHSIPLKKETINIVTSNLFEFVDKKVVVSEINRILKKDGICIVITLNKYSAYALPKRIASKLLNIKRDKNEASAAELKDLFKNNGFEIVEFKMDDGLIWLPDSLDMMIGNMIYRVIQDFARIVHQNPFSNVMLLVARKLK